MCVHKPRRVARALGPSTPSFNLGPGPPVHFIHRIHTLPVGKMAEGGYYDPSRSSVNGATSPQAASQGYPSEYRSGTPQDHNGNGNGNGMSPRYSANESSLNGLGASTMSTGNGNGNGNGLGAGAGGIASAAAPRERKKLSSWVGFSNLPNQVHRRSNKSVARVHLLPSRPRMASPPEEQS